MTHPQHPGERARDIKQAVREQTERIRADQKLTPQAKQLELARLYLAAAPELAQLQSQLNEQRAAERSRLINHAFGIGGVPLSDQSAYRAAMAEVDRGSEDDAIRQVARATFTSDAVTLRAIGTVAAVRGWGRCLNALAQAASAQADAIRAVQYLDDPRTRRAQRWDDSIAFELPSRPQELQNISDLHAFVAAWEREEGAPQRRADMNAAFRNRLRR